MQTILTRAEASPSVWQLIVSDLKRYRVTDRRGYFTMFIICPGPLACVTYRIGHWIWTRSWPLSVATFILRALYILFSRLVEIITGIRIAPRATIGPGLYIGHAGSVIIGGGVVMGSNCNLQQGVTIGTSSRGEQQGSPTLGNRVYVGPGAKMFGNIELSDDVAVGANAVVTKSFGSRAVVVGVPAHVVSYEGSFEYVLYEGMEDDPERLVSLALRTEAHAAVAVQRSTD